jgi:hypothetical protein
MVLPLPRVGQRVDRITAPNFKRKKEHVRLLCYPDTYSSRLNANVQTPNCKSAIRFVFIAAALRSVAPMGERGCPSLRGEVTELDTTKHNAFLDQEKMTYAQQSSVSRGR